MIHKDDWRLKRPRKYMERITLQFNQFKAFREGMDSDHCEFCWAKFVTEPKPDAHHEISKLQKRKEYLILKQEDSLGLLVENCREDCWASTKNNSRCLNLRSPSSKWIRFPDRFD